MYQIDFDRPLALKGQNDAGLLNKFLKNHKIIPDIILSSPAARTKETLEISLKDIVVSEKVFFKDELYHASIETVLNLIQLSDEEISSLMIIGHNPSMHNVFEQLSKQSVSKFPTCGFASIAFQDSWKNISKLVADEINFITPKSLKGP